MKKVMLVALFALLAVGHGIGADIRTHHMTCWAHTTTADAAARAAMLPTAAERGSGGDLVAGSGVTSKGGATKAITTFGARTYR
jgi:hypothetical protein